MDQPDSNWALIWRLSTEARQKPQSERSAYVESNSPNPATAHIVLTLLRDTNLSVAHSSITSAAGSGSGRTGLRLGRYLVQNFLGSGAFGQVYAAQDMELYRQVALKFLEAGALDRHWAPERFLWEAKATSALNHPNIVTVHEIIHSEDGLVIAMELVDGQSLRALCGQPCPARDWIRFGIQIARALAAAHAHGVIHRDIKPENIMVRTDGYVKVLDFGLAKDLDAGFHESARWIPEGTLRYMSPEQATGKPLTAATDLFSLGLILHELASGTHPFQSDTAIGTAHAIAHDPPMPPRDSVPQPLRAILSRLLAKNPADRPTASQTAGLLEAALEGLTTPARRRSLGATISGGFLFAILGGLAAARFWSKAPAPLEVLNIVSLTTLDGFAWESSFSPDGKQIAFSWDGGLTKRAGIYVQRVSGGTPVRISGGIAEEIHPAWSPDGSTVAFARRSKKGGRLAVVMVPSVGGPETPIGDIAEDQGFVNPIAWEPGGKALLVRDIPPGSLSRIIRLPLDGGPRKAITGMNGAIYEDTLPTPSLDGKWLAFLRVIDEKQVKVCVQPMQGGAPERCFAQGNGNVGMAWSSDGQSLYLARPRFLSRVNIAKGEESKIAEQPLKYLTGDRQGKQFAFSISVIDWNIWRLNSSAGQRYEKWIAASGQDSEPSYSPDGQRILFRSTRSGELELWVCAADGSNPRQLTHLKGRVESARWSPDGRLIAFWAVSHTDQLARVYVMPSDGGEPKGLTPNTWGSYYPIWTADGKSILFTGGETQAIWSVPADGSGHPVRFAPDKWLDAFVSSDGEWIYFTKDYETPGLWRMPARGAGDKQSERVEGTEGLVTYRYWDQVKDTVYFVDLGMSKTVRAFDLKNRRTRVIFPLDGELYLGPRGLAVSPDGKSILITKLDAQIGDIKMIDNLP